MLYTKDSDDFEKAITRISYNDLLTECEGVEPAENQVNALLETALLNGLALLKDLRGPNKGERLSREKKATKMNAICSTLLRSESLHIWGRTSLQCLESLCGRVRDEKGTYTATLAFMEEHKDSRVVGTFYHNNVGNSIVSLMVEENRVLVLVSEERDIGDEAVRVIRENHNDKFNVLSFVEYMARKRANILKASEVSTFMK